MINRIDQRRIVAVVFLLTAVQSIWADHIVFTGDAESRIETVGQAVSVQIPDGGEPRLPATTTLIASRSREMCTFYRPKK